LTVILVGIGGALGAVFRCYIGTLISQKNNLSFPLATFIINISGAFFLGAVMVINTDYNMYLLLAEGFLGSYTTFSTFMYEGVYLFQGSEKLNIALYILASVFFGIVGYMAGGSAGEFVKYLPVIIK
jgi:fluoride exporter